MLKNLAIKILKSSMKFLKILILGAIFTCPGSSCSKHYHVSKTISVNVSSHVLHVNFDDHFLF